MKYFAVFSVIIVYLGVTACTVPNSQPTPPVATTSISQLQEVTEIDLNQDMVMGQTIYVPVYSYIYYDTQDRSFNLATTVSIRNTDLQSPIIINSVRYYNTEGKLIQEYLSQPGKLAALASAAVVIDRRDTQGGLGANFIIEWQAYQPVSEPIIEAVMIGTDSGQGISFVSPGRVIQQYEGK